MTVHITGAGHDEIPSQAGMLRLKGRNIEENQHVKMGAYHTIDLELHKKFILRKPVWDSVHLERIELACDPSRSADVAAVIMSEGSCQVCLVTSCMTITRAKIDVNIPRKRRGDCSQHEKGLLKFYDLVITDDYSDSRKVLCLRQVIQNILRHVNFDVVKAVIIASPGFVRQQFFDYMYQQVREAVQEIKPHPRLPGC